MSATNIVIAIAAQTANAVREIDSVNNALGRQMTAGEKTGAAFKKMQAPAVAALAAVGAGALVAVRGAEEAAATSAKLGQVFESMGYADLADDAEAYAEALSKQIGVDDDVIKAAQTKLATFGEVAKSAELMGKATSLAADLSAAGFGDMSSQSVLLGKALNDPVKGVGALSKVGVTFTQQQKDQIAAMVKAGDTAGAQAIIMGELEKQVGGVAEAGATSSAKLSTAFGEIGESIGTALLPAFETLTPYIQDFAEWAADNGPVIAGVAGAIAVLAGSVLLVNGVMAVWAAVGTIATAVTSAFGVAVTIATSPITLIVLAVLAVIAVIVLLYKNWDSITRFLGTTWDAIKTKAVAVWGSLATWFGQTWDAIKAKVSEAWEGVKTAVSNGIAAVVTFAREMPGKILTAIGNLTSTLTGKGGDLIKGLVSGYLSIWVNVLDFFGNIAGKIAGAIGNLGSTLYGKGQDLIEGFIAGIRSMAGRILDAILAILPRSVRGVIGGALGLNRAAATQAIGLRSAPVAAAAAPASAGLAVNVTEDQIYRAVSRLLLRGDARNGRTALVG